MVTTHLMFFFFNNQYEIPASETEEGKKRLQEYFAALGQFADIFSRVEAAITLTLWRYAQIKPEVAKVILSGVKIDHGSSYIRQLAEINNVAKELRDDLEDVLQQLGIINGARNDLMHYGAQSVAEGEAIVSNALKAKGEPKIFPISPDKLRQMTVDLRKIAVHLNHRHLGQSMPPGFLGTATVESVLRSPWLYKLPTPPPAKTKKAEAQPASKPGPEQPHPPESSPG